MSSALMRPNRQCINQYSPARPFCQRFGVARTKNPALLRGRFSFALLHQPL